MKNIKKKKKISTALLFVFCCFSMYCSQITAYAEPSRVDRVNKALGNLMAEYKIHLSGVIGFGVMTSVVSFIYNFIQLGAYSSNPQKRGEVLHNLVLSGICTALLGGIGIIIAIFYYTVL